MSTFKSKPILLRERLILIEMVYFEYKHIYIESNTKEVNNVTKAL